MRNAAVVAAGSGEHVCRVAAVWKRPGNGLLLRWTALFIAIVLMPVVSGCGRRTGNPRIVVIAPSATANEPAPELSSAGRSLLYRAGASDVGGVAYVVDPNNGQPTALSLTPRRPDGQIEHAQPRRGQMLARNVAAVNRVMSREAATGPFDLLSEIAAAVRASRQPATLLVLSSGLSTAGGLDLRQVGWDASPNAVAAVLKSRGLLPDLAGWHVVFSGLGDTAGTQPALPLPQRSTLIGYWTAICRAAGASSCAVDDTTRPDPPSHSRVPVPVVGVPTVISVRGPNGARRVSVPDDQLFAFGSARLLTDADKILGRLVDEARTRHLLVSITGYASPDGGTQRYNIALSQRRALTVRTRMLLLGLPSRDIANVAWRGTDGLTSRACYQAGQLDEARCARLRRVVIILRPAAQVAT